MEQVSLLFTRRRHPGSVAIRAVTWSPWSHVDVLDERAGEVIGAEAGSGVVVRSLQYRLSKASHAAVVSVAVPDAQQVIAAARSQVGKPYDWLGVTGILLRGRHWQSPEDWFCSELAAWAVAQGGRDLFRSRLIGRITPQHLWMLDNPTWCPSHPQEVLAA